MPHFSALEEGRIFRDRQADNPMVRCVRPYHANCPDGLDHLDEYTVPANLLDNQDITGAIRLTMDTYAERGERL